MWFVHFKTKQNKIKQKDIIATTTNKKVRYVNYNEKKTTWYDFVVDVETGMTL